VGKRVALGQFAVVLLISAAVMGYQHPPAAAIAAHVALPWVAIAIAAAWPSWFTLFLDTSDGRVPLSAAWFVHAIPLVLLFRCVKFPGWSRLFQEALLMGVILLMAVVLVERKWPAVNSLPAIAVLFVPCALNGYGAVTELDVLLDWSPGTVVRSTVSAKHTQRTYSLQIVPWGPEMKTRNVAVPKSVFDAVEVGGSVCMVLRGGSLGIGWYTAQSCPWQGGDVSLGPENIFPSLGRR
jgi:hypothetical protein